MVEAYDEFDAVARIKQDCPIVLSVHPVQEKGGSILTRDIGGPKKIKDKELSLLCSQFSIIFGAGLPAVRTIELVAEQTADKRLRRMLKDVAADVAAGNSLADSFEQKAPGLPTTFLETVRAGEESGTLDHSFESLHHYFDKTAKTHDKVVSAMVYPVFLICVAVVVVTVLMLTAIPMFVRQFASMDIELPLVTRILIGASNFMTRYWYLLFGALFALIIGLKVWSKTESGTRFFALLRLKLPLLGKVERMNAASQFANTMSTILGAGMPMTRTLTITARVVHNHLIGLAVRDMVSGVEEGRHLDDCMRYCKWFPPMLVEMTGVGESTGSLETTLDTIGAYYDNEVNLAVSRMLSVLEPVIILVMAAFVVIIVLGFYLPMFTMYGNM